MSSGSGNVSIGVSVFLHCAARSLVHTIAGLQDYAELLQSYSTRETAAAEYITAVRPGLKVHTGKLHDTEVGVYALIVLHTPGNLEAGLELCVHALQVVLTAMAR
jgi:hypothetical protein